MGEAISSLEFGEERQTSSSVTYISSMSAEGNNNTSSGEAGYEFLNEGLKPDVPERSEGKTRPRQRSASSAIKSQGKNDVDTTQHQVKLGGRQRSHAFHQ